MNYKTLLDNWFRGIYGRGYHDAMEWVEDVQDGNSKKSKIHKHEDQTVAEALAQFKSILEGWCTAMIEEYSSKQLPNTKEIFNQIFAKWVEYEIEWGDHK